MRSRSRRRLAALLGMASALAGERVGGIEFFGHKGLDVAKIRASLPVREGESYSEALKSKLRDAVAAAIGKQPTDVAAICCDEGNRLLFIGLPGASYKAFVYNPPPTGSERLPDDILRLSRRLDRAIMAAVRKGGPSAEEDDSNGYALINDAAARSLQLAVRKWAVQNDPLLLRVLSRSSSVEHRRVAADAAGYTRHSRDQILALINAARDPDDEVRNNATRALGVLAGWKKEAAAEIPPEPFIQMLNSGVWSDRNKASALLMQMTVGRDPEVLAKIRSGALDALIEMAEWRRPSHAFMPRVVLGRVAGIPEERLQRLAWSGPVEEITRAAAAGLP